MLKKTGALDGLLGRVVIGSVVKENMHGTTPEMQLFLILDDGNYFETYGVFHFTYDLRQGGKTEVRKYMDGGMRIIYESHVDEKRREEDD